MRELYVLITRHEKLFFTLAGGKNKADQFLKRENFPDLRSNSMIISFFSLDLAALPSSSPAQSPFLPLLAEAQAFSGAPGVASSGTLLPATPSQTMGHGYKRVKRILSLIVCVHCIHMYTAETDLLNGQNNFVKCDASLEQKYLC